jgi:hypothetical protein
MAVSVTEEQIGDQVARLRGDRSQKAIADEMRSRGWKWSQATVWSVEQGKRPLRFSEAIDLEAVLGASLDLAREPVDIDVVIAQRDFGRAGYELHKAVLAYNNSRHRLEQVQRGRGGSYSEAVLTDATTFVREYEHPESFVPAEAVTDGERQAAP